MKDRNTTVISGIFHGTEMKLPRRKRVILLNGTGHNSLYLHAAPAGRYSAVTYDHLHRPLNRKRLLVDEGTRIPVAPGGVVVLQKL